MSRNRFTTVIARILTAVTAVLASVLPELYTERELQRAADRVRAREDCRARSTDYACGLEDGAVSVLVEVGAGCTCTGRDACSDCGGRHSDYPEAGWATDTTSNDTVSRVSSRQREHDRRVAREIERNGAGGVN